MSITSTSRACIVAGLAALTMLLAIPLSAHASQDILVKFNNAPELQGEVQDKAALGAISATELSWGIENPMTIGSSSGGAGAGKAKFEELEIKKLVDASSPGLMMAAGKGAPIPSASIMIRKDAGKMNTALQYSLKNVFVTKIDTSASAGDDGVYETVTLRVGSIQQRYVQARPTGALNPIIAGWDQVANSQTTPADWSPFS
jgi:type VI secretion system secreted protein Hcp